MEEYTKNLMAYQIPCAQILLNRSDFEDRRRYKNIFGSLSVLLGRGAIPIINENDTIAIEELKVGDNDTLSAQVAAMLHASLLILLTDIDGLYTANPKSDPNARHIDVVNEITPELTAAAGGAGSGNGTGGMTTKLSAASLATRAGVPVLICSSAEENNIVRAVKGTAKGTYFTASGHNMKTRLQWMAFYAPSAATSTSMRVPQKHLLFRQRACFLKASWQSKAISRKAMSSASSGAAAMNISERALSTMTGRICRKS